MNSLDRNLSRPVADADTPPQRADGEAMDDISIYLQIRSCNAMMNDRLNRTLDRYQLSNVGFFAMMVLRGRASQMANPSELCEVTGETRGNMTRICDELVDKGHLSRVPNPEDRRRVDLSLTARGRRVLDEIVPELRQRSTQFYKKFFTKAERATLQQLLGRFADALERSSV